MKISIACDHAGYELKETVKKWLSTQNLIVEDEGCYSAESVDYPDYAHKTGEKVNNGTCDAGIVICGSGNGVNMTVNKYENVRSALCWNLEIAKMARLHNDNNIIALPARFVTVDEALAMVEIFLNTEFEGGRHQKRIDKIKLSTPNT